MKIASWNVNSVRSRLDQLTAWLARAVPDVLCMQETKVEDEIFPHDALAEVGYRTIAFGQKTYNGVAIAAKLGLAIEDVRRNLDDGNALAERRFIAATIEGLRIVNVYVPNGKSIDDPAYVHKLEWLDHLRRDVAARHTPADDLVICGDFNVAPEPIDVAEPKKWERSILYTPQERAALKRLLDWGLVDVYRARHPGEPGVYSWWDYRMGAFKKNRGLRIDLALGTRSVVERCTTAVIDRRPRELERPSDHAPLVLELGPGP